MKRFLVLPLVWVWGASVALWSPVAMLAGTFAGNGDMNEDGSRDISDAIYLLAALFQGGPQPVPCPGQPPGELDVILPATNQTVCFNSTFAGPYPLPLPLPDSLPPCGGAGVDPDYCHPNHVNIIPDHVSTAEVACGNSTCAGQDGSYQTGCPTAGRFVDNLNGTVTDRCTGLMWTKEVLDADNSGTRDVDDNINWCTALTLCESLNFAGNQDWRLPSIRELENIVDYSGVPTIDPVFDLIVDPEDVQNVIGFVCWSSTSYDEAGNSAPGIGSMDLGYCVYFDDTEKPGNLKTASSLATCFKGDDACEDGDRDRVYARAVRTVPLPGGGAATSGNGDVNGDDSRDISDVIYLLAFLFQGGPAPVNCPAGGGAGLPLDVNNVGRITSSLADNCYEVTAGEPDTWSFGDCATVSCPGQDGSYQQPGSNENTCHGDDRFVDNLDGTVTDHCTNLMWPQASQSRRLDWCRALAYADAIVLTAGTQFKLEQDLDAQDPEDAVVHADWRMPSIRELETIVDYDKVNQQLAGPMTAGPAFFLSSTTLPSELDKVWGFLGQIAARIPMKKNDPQWYVRVVRTVK